LFCMKVSAAGGSEKYFPNFSYEIKCDLTNKILEPKEFINTTRLMVINKSVKPKYTFQKFTTLNEYCDITKYEIHKPNVTGILLGPFPSREI